MSVLHALVHGIDGVLMTVVAAIGPLVVLLILCQAIFLRMSPREFGTLLRGFLICAVGLLLFLQGVDVAFIPVGEELGRVVATKWSPWWLVPIGFALGFLVAFAEPAVQLLSDEVYSSSGGAIPKHLILWTLAIGIGISVALAIGRTILGIPLWALLIPGHLLALLMIRWAEPDFIGIAFDSGGAATGPMTVSFLVALALGVAAAAPDRDALLDGFGLVSFVLLTPILCVLIVGVLYARKRRAISESAESGSRAPEL